jgi:formylglycine-generating enzyme required for sulfatase activity
MPCNGAFGWDNEYQAHAVDVPAFSVGQHKVTNGEYLDFVKEGADPPFFWTDRGAGWLFRGMFSEYPLPLDAPVYVTQEQATAYARWRGMRLPTEAEYHRAAHDAPPSANLNFRNWDPVSVTADDDGTRRPMQLAGNGWEWTSTLFAPFPGFTPFPFYRNYSEPFFDGAHYVLKGASPRTAECFLRPSFRNWFRPSYPYVYATFRMVKS